MKQWLTGAPLVTQTGRIRWLQLGLECSACGLGSQQEQTGMHLSLSYRSWPRTAALTAVVGHAGSQEAVGSGLHVHLETLSGSGSSSSGREPASGVEIAAATRATPGAPVGGAQPPVSALRKSPSFHYPRV